MVDSQGIVRAASVGLAGFNSNPNPNLMVENHGRDSSTCRLDQNVLHQDMNNASLPPGNLMLSNKNFSGVEDDASSVGFGGGFTTTTVEAAAASSSNVVDLSPSNQNQTGDYFDDLHDILFNDTKLEPVNHQQNSNREVIEEGEFDWLDLLDATAILENVSLDEDWKKFMDTILNG
ncbi:hypothetical protein ACLB2K_077131 [Fragaria x ananassa]